jgi:hypothetical protein
MGLKSDRRIIYLLKPFEVPFGGVAVIYDHVEILAQSGYQAFIALSNIPAQDFYNSNAPTIIHNGAMEFRRGDICVIPEGFPDYMQALKAQPIKKVMFCQSQSYLPFSSNSNLGFSEFCVDSIIASSEAIISFMREVYGLTNVPLIPCAIDTKLFFNGEKKVRQIALMPRKLPEDAIFIEAIFKRMYKEYSDIPWVSIEGVSRQRAAEILRESEVFLSLSHRDSFGLPPLEAMASGCLVAGFHGNGGKEYMHGNNGWWAEDGDFISCAKGIASALKLIDDGGSKLEEMQGEILKTVNKYSRSKMKKALLDYWEVEIKTPLT